MAGLHPEVELLVVYRAIPGGTVVDLWEAIRTDPDLEDEGLHRLEA